MSHYSILVIGDNIEQKLAPYQENNMGDYPEEFLEFVDMQDEFDEEWESNESTVQQIYPRYLQVYDATLIDELMTKGITGFINYSSVLDVITEDKIYEFYFRGETSGTIKSSYAIVSDVTGNGKEGYTFKACKVMPPEKYKIRDYYKTYEEFVRDYHGFNSPDEKTGRYGYWKNPQAKWDYYRIGGRYTGLLQLKENGKGRRGEKGYEWKYTDVKPHSTELHVDQAAKGDIDWKAMSNNPEEKISLGKQWDRVMSGEDFYTPQYFKDRWVTKENYIRLNMMFSTYAVITEDGKWHAPGEVGWWGCSSEEHEDKRNFIESFYDMFIKNLPDDTLLTIVDCHI